MSSQRNEVQFFPGEARLHFKNQQVASASDLLNSLSEADVASLNSQPQDNARMSEGELVRHFISNPKIMIYATTRDKPNLPIHSSEPLWAVRVVFPTLSVEEEQKWISEGGGEKILVNTVWQEQFFGSDDESEDFDEEIDG